MPGVHTLPKTREKIAASVERSIASYATLQPGDVKALYAYFMQGVPAQPTPNRAVDIPWPLSMRWPLGLWRSAFGPAVAVETGAVATADGAVARGRYLVEGLGHCGPA